MTAQLPPMLPMDTHEDRMAAIRAIPTAAQYANEGRLFYIGLLAETYWGLLRAWTAPYGRTTMTDHEALARLGSNGDGETLP